MPRQNKLIALLRRSQEGKETVCGTYSDRDKAKIAATHMIRHLDRMEAKKQKWSFNERTHEITYVRSDKKIVLTIDFWRLDKALIDGVFKEI